MKIRLINFLTLFFLLGLTGCAELFQEKVPMSNIPNGTLTGLLYEEAIITELQTPSQLFVSQNMSPSDINITWSSVEGAVSYRLEKAVVSPDPNGLYIEPDESMFEVLELSVYGTSYVDVILDSADSYSQEYNNRYYYRVSAENSRQKYGSSPYTESQYGTLFASPKNVTASLGESTNSITVKWNEVKGANKYEIYRTKDSTGTGAVHIATVTSDRLQFEDSIDKNNQGVEFYYSVFARNRHGTLSAQSSLALGYALVEGAPQQPQNMRVVKGRGTTVDKISLEWDAVQSTGEVKYYVFRTSSLDSAFKLLTTTTSTTFDDTVSLKENVYYYYQVQASVIDNLGVELKSKFSASGPTDENPAEGFILSPPSLIIAEKNKNSGDTIRWWPAIGSEQERTSYVYEIYGSSTIDFEVSELITSVSTTEVDAEGYHTITLNINQNAAYYKIKTRNSEGLQSNFSEITAPSPFPAEFVYATIHEKLDSEYMVANSSGVYPVKITWAKPKDDNPASYHVYRSTKKDSGYRKITENPVTGLSFVDIDDTTKAGKIYYYKVLSLNALQQGSMYSEYVIGYGALTPDQYMREFNKTMKASHKKLTLMHKSNDMDKLGQETIYGSISGSCKYHAKIAGAGADITMRYENFAEFYIDNDSTKGVYFNVTGNTDTSANMSANGSMSGTMVCKGMYPGKVYYDNIEIKGGSAGGGTYGIEPEGFTRSEVSWTIGEE
ncbi:MAG: hypothetical protein E7063_05270 [Spirochaetaceae bacterium]|nr:hypothetical protein [Spirochaetaceae bacterium]